MCRGLKPYTVDGGVLKAEQQGVRWIVLINNKKGGKVTVCGAKAKFGHKPAAARPGLISLFGLELLVT